MKKFIFYCTNIASGRDAKIEIEASNQGIALARFKQSHNGCLKIRKIDKEKNTNGKI